MLTAANSAGTYTLHYDGAGRVSEVDGPFGVDLTFGYDGGGNRISVTDNMAGETDSTFNAADELASRVLSAASTTAQVLFGYDAAGDEISETRSQAGANAGSTDLIYDDSGLVTSISTVSASGSGLFDEAYTYDEAGRLHSVRTFGVDVVDYSYDAAGQLLSDGVDTYGYDDNGVPDVNGLTPGADNQVSTDGLWTYTYDNAGDDAVPGVR